MLINLTSYTTRAIELLSTERNLNYLIEFLRYADEHLLQHSLWLIGNVTADIHFARVYIAKSGVITKLASLLNDFSTTDELKEKIVWTLCNLYRGKLGEHFYEFIEVINPIIKYLMGCFDHKEIKECLYVIFKLTSSTGVILSKFISVEVFKLLVKIMNEYDYSIKFYCVRIIANLLSGNDVQTQTLINEGIIELYRGLIEDDDVGIIKEVLWGLSNICAGTVSQIERVFDCGLLSRVLEIANYLLLKVEEDKTFYEVNSNFIIY